jgi:hypothetical protein
MPGAATLDRHPLRILLSAPGADAGASSICHGERFKIGRYQRRWTGHGATAPVVSFALSPVSAPRKQDRQNQFCRKCRALRQHRVRQVRQFGEY